MTEQQGDTIIKILTAILFAVSIIAGSVLFS
jgi:hypothetical protein